MHPVLPTLNPPNLIPPHAHAIRRALAGDTRGMGENHGILVAKVAVTRLMCQPIGMTPQEARGIRLYYTSVTQRVMFGNEHIADFNQIGIFRNRPIGKEPPDA